MKTIILNTALLFASNFIFAATQVKNVKAPVQKATVYLSGAMLKHSTTVQLSAGNNELVIENVSPYTHANSIQTFSKANILITDTRFEARNPETIKVNSKKDSKLQNQLREVLDSLDALGFDIDELHEQKTNLATEKNLLLNNRLIKGEGKKDSIELVRDAMDYVHVKLAQLNTQVTKIKKEEKLKFALKGKLELRRSEVQRLISQIENGQVNDDQKPLYCVIITIQATAAISATIDLSYFTDNAGWNPEYDIKANAESAKISIVQKAILFQNTGLDWNECQLTLSTSQPTIGQTKPVMNPYLLSVIKHQNRVSKNARSTRSQAESMPAMVMPTEALGASEMDKPTDIKAEDVDASYAYDYTNVNENLIDVEYDIKLKYEIPSDGKTHQVLIQQKEIAVSFQYYAAPKLDKNAFLMARLTNFESLNLIPANAKIFLDGSFVSENYLDVNSNEDTLNINLGRDRSIEIKRERIKNKQVDQFLTGKIVKSYEYELTIKNPKVSNAEFIVLDQVPISNDKDIVVEIIKKDGANLEKHTGKLSWNLKLKAKETTKLNFAYEVSYPSGLPVAGL